MAQKLRFTFATAALCGWFLFPAAVSPASAGELHLSAGVKGTWMQWGMNLGGDRITSGIEPVIGGEIGLNKGPVFAGLQVFGGHFNFGDRQICSGGGCQKASHAGADLLQLETGIGYYARPWLGPYIGYFYQSQTLRFTLSADGKSTTDQSLGVLMVGALLNRSWLGQRAAVYGNVAALGPGSGDGLGGLGEIGFSYAARTLPLGFTISFRYQFFHYDHGALVLNGQTRAHDDFAGFNAEIHFTK
jgi:hypothetical protein